ncbi:MAG: C39 family peptidase [Bacteriovorax sp.]|nr:C39 family peptidase [Bacteriovorax sp.]
MKYFLFILLFSWSNLSYASVPNNIGIISQKDFTPPVSVSDQSAWLDVQQVHQETNLCAPTSAAMVLTYYTGNIYLPREIKLWSLGLTYNSELPFNSFTATYFNDLISGLKSHSIMWQKQLYSNNQTGYLEGIEAIKKQLDQQHPVLVDTALYTGHTFVIEGYNETKNILIIVDPFIQAPGIRVISYNDFKQIWNSTKVKSNIRAAIFTSSP